MALTDAFRQAGYDMDVVLRRFSGNEGLLERFLKKFLADPSYGKLEEAVNSGDLAAIEASAHTLKGVAANLGFQSLSDSCAAMVSGVRSGQTDMGAFGRMLEEVTREYDKVIELIEGN